eukprot:1415871-Amphidinium_carterae.1
MDFRCVRSSRSQLIQPLLTLRTLQSQFHLTVASEYGPVVAAGKETARALFDMVGNCLSDPCTLQKTTTGIGVGWRRGIVTPCDEVGTISGGVSAFCRAQPFGGISCQQKAEGPAPRKLVRQVVVKHLGSNHRLNKSFPQLPIEL